MAISICAIAQIRLSLFLKCIWEPWKNFFQTKLKVIVSLTYKNMWIVIDIQSFTPFSWSASYIFVLVHFQRTSSKTSNVLRGKNSHLKLVNKVSTLQIAFWSMAVGWLKKDSYRIMNAVLIKLMHAQLGIPVDLDKMPLAIIEWYLR